MFESLMASRSTPESVVLLDRVREAGRAEAQAAARRLVAVGELHVLRCRDSGETQHWATDTWDAVAAQVAAALHCSLARGHATCAMPRRCATGSLRWAGCFGR